LWLQSNADPVLKSIGLQECYTEDEQINSDHQEFMPDTLHVTTLPNYQLTKVYLARYTNKFEISKIYSSYTTKRTYQK